MSLPPCDLKFCDCDAHDSVLTLCVPLIGGVFFTMVSEDHVNENCSGYSDIHSEAEGCPRKTYKNPKWSVGND